VVDDTLPGPPGRARRWPKILGGFGIALVVLLAGTYLIPVGTSGTLHYRDAAPPGTEFIDIGGVDVAVSPTAYVGEGESPILFLLLHGFGASSFSWREVVEPLSQRGDVIAYDRTGFGFSERPESWRGTHPYGSEVQCAVLSAVAEHYLSGQSKIVVVGHSAGGTLALDCVIFDDFPATHLVLVAPAALSGGPPPGSGLIRWVPPLNRLGPLLVRGISESGNDLLFDSVVDQTILTPDVLAGYRAPLTVSGWEQGLWRFTQSPRRDVRVEGLAGVSVPTIVITGDSDQIVSPVDSQTIADAIPGAMFVDFERVGHLPQEEDPEATVGEIDRFLGVTFREGLSR
jgi:pimeloyl-ACP methyl ester carboxylesterase